ncbi:Endonuclease/exonuclease/phosphatase [Naematelia encephala]|uniref:Endonuclease/exonuclease/phosphatase n=1 Tax=Naematelia encephala TaxID=71784 RepID=A0A1Y2BL11_9TREE|nr:Endonuclease/exonuclease/phosphatase [Naematelia encephala]
MPSSAAPPPIPGHKPPSSSLPTVLSQTTDEPPRLPSRSRASTLTLTDEARAALPPRLPARTNTLQHGGTLPLPPTHTANLSSPQRSREGSISSDLPQRHRSILHREHSHSVDESAAHSWLHRHLDHSSTSLSDYQPPPPPQRNTSAAPSTPPRREYSKDKEAEEDSEGEDDDEAGQTTIISGAVKRAMEDYPDSTHANRRPPSFVPEVKIVGAQHVNAFAVHGRYVCTGSHMVRVYDTLMSDRPIFTVDLRDTGLESRIKDPKITAMCFKPAHDSANDGRYLWCGTKDGHLWELDIKTGQVTETRPYAHASSVAYIFRHQHYLLTLEEAGKLHVFDSTDKSSMSEDRYIPNLLRTLRVSDRFTFAKMIRGQLWTSTGPAARSTTSTTSKGPTIRVYQPCVEGASPPPVTLFTSEWTGAVTSATVMPMNPDEVLLGHEGGFISIWNVVDMTCVQVLKISPSDILSLEGVGERLWAGNRRGQIHVYDMSEKPWVTTNVWLAHPDHPVSCLMVDPSSPEQSGRFCLWSCARDSLKAWDGLLSVDWIDKQMELRQEDYCSFRDINILVCSWNIDSAKPTDLSGSEANTTFLNRALTSVDSPDIIVFGFQEVIPLTNKTLTAKTLLFGGKNRDGATDDKVSIAYRQWLDKLTTAVRQAAGPDCPYVKIHSESLVGLFTSIFVKSSEKDWLRDMDICTVKRGIGGIYGNKGAIIARLVIDDTSFCFINVHLAAGQSQKAARNADLGGIMEDKAIFSAADNLPFVHGGDGTAILDHEMVILNGDLNYRIDQRRENVLSSIAANDLAFLLEHDQLRKEMRNNHHFRLRSFDEPPIEFAPTYKYDKGSDDYDNSEKRRIPAWCDRILHTKSPRIQCLNYQRYETTASDHKPISAGFKMTIKSVDNTKMAQVRKEVGAEWAKREAEVLDKMAVAFEKLL